MKAMMCRAFGTPGQLRRETHGFLTISLAAGLACQLRFGETAAHAIPGLSWRLPRRVVPGDVFHVGLTPDRAPGVAHRYDVRNQSGETVAVGGRGHADQTA